MPPRRTTTLRKRYSTSGEYLLDLGQRAKPAPAGTGQRSSGPLAYDQNDQASTQSTAQLKLAVDQATNGLELAKLNLQYATIRAPFDGQLAAVECGTPGMYLGLNSAAFVLVSSNKQINFSVPPVDAPGFKMGDTVTFSVGGKNYPVRIIQTPSAPISGVVPMVASVPTTVPVSYGTVGTIIYKLTIGNGPQIPLSALQSRANINFVDSIQNGKAVEVSGGHCCRSGHHRGRVGAERG